MGGALLVAALTLLPWQADDATAIQSGLGVGAALAAVAAVAWLALAMLTPRPPVPDPGRRLVAPWAVALALVVIKLVADLDGVRVGAWSSAALAAALVALSARRGTVTATATSS